jgi:hypothetical protein
LIFALALLAFDVVGRESATRQKMKLFSYCFKLASRGRFVDERTVHNAALALSEHCHGWQSVPIITELTEQLIKEFVFTTPTGDPAAMLSLLLPKLLADLPPLTQAAQIASVVTAAKWPPKCIIGLISVMREVPLTADQADGVVQRVVAQLRSLELDVVSFPPVLSQLLLFANTKDCVDTFLPAVCGLFEQLGVAERRADQRRMLHHVEGTVLLHLEFSMRHRQTLASKLIALIKADRIALRAPFAVALLLTAGAVPRFESDAFKLARTLVQRACETAVELEAMAMHKTRTAFEALGAQESTTATRAALAVALPVVVPRALLDCVEHSENGWDHVIEALVKLGEMLITPRKQLRAPVMALQGAIGRELLALLFARRAAARGAIVQFIVSQLLLSTDSAPHCVRLLETIVRSSGQHLVPHTRALRDALECVPQLQPPSLAPLLLGALAPLLADNASSESAALRDTTMLVLRKSLFARAEESRRAACDGFVALLQHVALVECRCGAAGGATCMCATTMSDAALATCHEILGALQRCCSQQLSVRARLYAGLTSFVRQLARYATDENVRARDGRNEALAQAAELLDAVLSLLLAQLAQQCTGNLEALAAAGAAAASAAVLVPIQLERAFDVDGAARGTVPTQLEPLDDLFASLIACLHASRALAVSAELVASPTSAYSRAVAALEYVAAQLPRPELEDWALDPSTPFAPTTNIGAFNQQRGQLLLRIFEVFAGYRIVARAFPRHAGAAAPPTLIMAVADSSAFLTLYGRLFAVIREGERAGAASSSNISKAARLDADANDEPAADDDDGVAAAAKGGKARKPPIDRRAKLGAALAGATLRFDAVAAHQLLCLAVGGDFAAELWPDVTAEQREHASARARCDVELRHHVLRAVAQHLDDVARERRLADTLMPVDSDLRRRFAGVSGFERSRRTTPHTTSQSASTTTVMADHVELASSERQRQLEAHAQCVALARVLFAEYERMGASERLVKRNAKTMPALVLEAFAKAWLLLTASDEAGAADVLSVARAVLESDYESACGAAEARSLDAVVNKNSRPLDSGREQQNPVDEDVVVQVPMSSGGNASDQRRREVVTTSRRQYLLGKMAGALFERVAALLALEATPVRECELLVQCVVPLAMRTSGASADKLATSVGQALRLRDELAPIKHTGVARALVALFGACEMRVSNSDSHKDLLKIANSIESLLGSCDRSRMPSEVDEFASVVHNASIVHVIGVVHQAIEARLDYAEVAIEYGHRVLAACPIAMQLVRSVAASGSLLDIEALLVKKESDELPTPPPLAPIVNAGGAPQLLRAKSGAAVSAALPALDPVQRRSVAMLASSVLSALDNVYATVRMSVAMLYRLTIAAQPPACAERQTRLLTRVMKVLTVCVRDASSVATRRQPTQKLLRMCTAATQYMFKQTSTWLTYLSDLPIRAASIRKLNLGKKRARAQGEGGDDFADDDGDAGAAERDGEESENEAESALALLQKQQMDVKRVERDVKLVPALVESLERFHTMLLKFEKFVKIDELTNSVPQSAAREFQLDIEALRRQGKLLAAQNGPMADNDDDDDDDGDENGKKVKRARQVEPENAQMEEDVHELL